MLVEPAAALPRGPEWDYEYSWPGERVLVAKEGAGVRLVSALHRRDLTNRFPVIAANVAKLAVTAAVLDGVVRPLDSAQAAVVGATAAEPFRPSEMRLIATDILWIEGLDLRQLPLEMRRHRLSELTGGSGILIAAPLDVPYREMLEQAVRVGADGVIAKRRDSRYRPFARNGDWVRVSALRDRTVSVRVPSVPQVHRPPTRIRGSAFGAGWGHAVT